MSLNQKGALALVLAMAILILNDGMMKLAGRDIAIGEAIALRGLMMLAAIAAILAVRRELGTIRQAITRPVLTRSVFDGLANAAYLVALQHLPIADASGLVLVSPLILTILSIVFLGEVIRIRRWIAIGIGFAGALVILRPGSSAFTPWAIVGLLAAFMNACRDLSTIRIHSALPTLTVVFVSACFVALAGGLIGLSETWTVPPLAVTAKIALAAALFIFGAFWLVLAFRTGEASAVAPFRYSLLIWSALTGYLLFGTLPDRWFFVGGTLIVGSGLYTLYRETVLRRELSVRSTPPG